MIELTLILISSKPVYTWLLGNAALIVFKWGLDRIPRQQS